MATPYQVPSVVPVNDNIQSSVKRVSGGNLFESQISPHSSIGDFLLNKNK